MTGWEKGKEKEKEKGEINSYGACRLSLIFGLYYQFR